MNIEPLKEALEKHRQVVAEKDETRVLLAQIEKDFEEQPAPRANIPTEVRVQVLEKAVPQLAKRVNILEETLEQVQEALLVAVIGLTERLDED